MSAGNPMRARDGRPRELQVLTRRHEAIALFMLQHPSMRDRDIAAEFNLSPSSLTRLKQEPLFLDYYDSLKAKYLDESMKQIQLKQLKLAGSSMDLVQERIDTGAISTKDAISVMTSVVPYVAPKKGTEFPNTIAITQNNFNITEALESAKRLLLQRSGRAAESNHADIIVDQSKEG